ncbi:MAG: N-acetylmuramoyl-L-alanine amidase [Bacteroidales bacterium]|jgi:hypothetical protein|nr:N-acetylmuramoyl-L-alanine amidase [Bacteroidales bacterium]
MKKITAILFVCFAYMQLYSQNFRQISSNDDGFVKIITSKLDGDISRNADNTYGMKLKIPIQATSVVVGWQTTAHKFQAGNFGIRFRMHKEGKGWNFWQEDDCLINPDQNLLNIYKSDLLFGWDEGLHDSLEFYLYSPENEQITELYLFSQDISGYLNKKHSNEATKLSNRNDCPAFPDIVLRTSWCGSNNSCLNPSYSVVYRPNMTHSVIHHGASPTSYTDGAAVVYSYWVYHTTASPNGNGWEDIGYNYLFDKYGNMFQGRHNPQLPNVDVHAAHAGYANTYSIGCNFLGDSDSPNTAATEIQLNKVADLLAWWYDTHKEGLDPLSSASIHLQPADGGSAVKPRICGHRDVHPGGTTCPGDALYALLPTIRTKTAQKIAACQDNSAPTTEIMTGKEWQNGDFLVHFHDVDENSDIKYAFYNIEYQQNNILKTNTNNGFLKEDFTVPSNNWIHLLEAGGIWNIANGVISMNTTTSYDKISVPVKQEVGGIYLYTFKVKFNGTDAGTDRAVLHFFCDSITDAAYFEAAGGGRSYAVFLRNQQNTLQIYRWEPYSGIAVENAATFNANIWYDFKVIFNTNTHKIEVYMDNLLLSTWTDPNELTYTGKGIALKVAQGNVSFDDVAVYKQRTVNQMVTVGGNADIPVESANYLSPAGKINTILTDDFGNWSPIYSKNVFVDVNNQIHPEIHHDTLYITQHDTTYLTEYQYIYDTIYIYDCDISTMNGNSKEGTLLVYPNPVETELFVTKLGQNSNKMETKLEIYDVSGKLQFVTTLSQSCHGLVTPINVIDLKPGYYFLKIGNKVVKFVKQ